MPRPARAGSYARRVSQGRARLLVGLAATAAAALVVGVDRAPGRGRQRRADDDVRGAATAAARAGPHRPRRPRERGRLARRRGAPRRRRPRERPARASTSCWPRTPIPSRPPSGRRSRPGRTGPSSACRSLPPTSRRAASPGSTSGSPCSRAATAMRRPRQWEEAERRDPDSPAALRAEDHPPSRSSPRAARRSSPRCRLHPELEGLTPEEQLARLERDASLRRRRGEARLRDRAAAGRARPSPHGEAFADAAEADPISLPAKVAAALGRFDKDDPAQAFSRLGPLAASDEDGVVRYHLGLALSWLARSRRPDASSSCAQEADPDGFYGTGSEAAPGPSRGRRAT